MRKNLVRAIIFFCLFFGISLQIVQAEVVVGQTRKELSGKFKHVSDEKHENASLLFILNIIFRTGKNDTFKPLTEGSILYSGAHYKIIFTPSVNCFVYIFQMDSAGKIFQLFPMESFAGVRVDNFNPVQKDKTYYLPAEGKSFQLDEQIGTEKIYFLASRERDLELEKLYQEAFEAQQQAEDELEIRLLEIDRMLERAINVQGALSPADDDSEKISWEEEGQSFTVLQERLENMCDGCVYVLSFEHR